MIEDFNLATCTYEIELRPIAFGFVEFLRESKFSRLVEVEAQGFPMFGTLTRLGYFTIVAMIGCKILQRLSGSHIHSPCKRSTCLAALGFKKLQGKGHCQNNKSAYESPFDKNSDWRR